MKPLVIFDLDGVLCDFVYGFTGLLLALQGKDLHGAYSTGAQLQWSFDVPGDVLDNAWNTVNGSEDFWSNLPSLLTEIERQTLRVAAQQYDLRFLTSRPSSTARTQSERWLSKQGLLVGPVVVAADKLPLCRALNPVAIIDDKPDVITDMLSIGLPVYTRDWSYNRAVVGPRVSSVTEFLHRVHLLTSTQ